MAIVQAFFYYLIRWNLFCNIIYDFYFNFNETGCDVYEAGANGFKEVGALEFDDMSDEFYDFFDRFKDKFQLTKGCKFILIKNIFWCNQTVVFFLFNLFLYVKLCNLH
jgi:hypothetical protein